MFFVLYLLDTCLCDTFEFTRMNNPTLVINAHSLQRLGKTSQGTTAVTRAVSPTLVGRATNVTRVRLNAASAKLVMLERNIFVQYVKKSTPTADPYGATGGALTVLAIHLPTRKLLQPPLSPIRNCPPAASPKQIIISCRSRASRERSESRMGATSIDRKCVSDRLQTRNRSCGATLSKEKSQWAAEQICQPWRRRFWRAPARILSISHLLCSRRDTQCRDWWFLSKRSSRGFSCLPHKTWPPIPTIPMLHCASSRRVNPCMRNWLAPPQLLQRLRIPMPKLHTFSILFFLTRAPMIRRL